jgi:hypothetical protein
MAVFGPPPTPALRDEWRSLPKETRQEAISVLFGPRGISDAEVQEKLTDLGMSTELAEWAAREAMERIRFLGRMMDTDSEPAKRRGRLDRFNAVLVTLITTLLSLTWFAQEAQALREGMAPIGIIPASVISLFSCLFFLVCLRGWLRSLKRP